MNIKINYFSIEAYPITLVTAKELNYDNLIDNPAIFSQLHENQWNETVDISPFTAAISNLIQFVGDDIHDPFAGSEDDQVFFDLACQFLKLVCDFLDAKLCQAF